MTLHRQTALLGALALSLTLAGLGALGPTGSPAVAAEATLFLGGPATPLATEMIRGTGTLELPKASSEELQDQRTVLSADGELDSIELRRQTNASALAYLATKYQNERPDLYLNAGLFPPADTTEADGFIVFASDPGEEVRAELSTLPFTISMRYGNGPSGPELRRLVRSLTTSMHGIVSQGQNVVAHLDDETGAVAIRYDGDRLDPTKVQEAVAAGEAESKVENAKSSLVTVTNVQDLPKNRLKNTVEGGRILYDAFWHLGTCTAGFTAKISGGSSGVLTARHCPNGLLYRDDVGAIANDRTAVNYDQEFYKTLSGNGHTTSANFYVGNGSTRIAAGTKASVVGDIACVYGFVGGYNCDVIAQTYYECFVLGGLNYCGNVYTQHIIAVQGDSGGPWFSGRYAMGIESGDDGSRERYTNIAWVWEGLGVFVLTSP